MLDRQNRLAQAEYTYLTNLINYKKSVIALQKSMYTILENNNYDLDRDSLTSEPKFK